MVDKEVPLIEAKKTPQKDVRLDPEGFFVIEVKKGQIRVEYYSNVYKKKKIVSGKLEKVFSGTQADALSDTIARYLPQLRQEHYLYLGRELQRAQHALEHHEKYVQEGC
jgi:hypothetical protein